jgi:hypothetical protein
MLRPQRQVARGFSPRSRFSRCACCGPLGPTQRLNVLFDKTACDGFVGRHGRPTVLASGMRERGGMNFWGIAKSNPQDRIGNAVVT